MRTPIYKTEEQATLAAKRQALANFSFDVDETIKDQWLVTDTSCQCDCGETHAIRVVFFDAENNQHYGMAGICEACGEDY